MEGMGDEGEENNKLKNCFSILLNKNLIFMLFLGPQSNLLVLMDLLLKTSPSPQQKKSSWSTPLTFSDLDVVQPAKADMNVNTDFVSHWVKIVYFLCVCE